MNDATKQTVTNDIQKAGETHQVKIESIPKKLVELPINSLIKSEKVGLFMKGDPGIWYEVFGHCSECEEKVHEQGVSPEKVGDYAPDFTTALQAEEYLAPYEVLAVGVEVKHRLKLQTGNQPLWHRFACANCGDVVRISKYEMRRLLKGNWSYFEDFLPPCSGRIR